MWDQESYETTNAETQTMQRAYERIVLNITWRDREIACEQALLFGWVKLVSRERAGERRSREGRSRVLARLASLAQIGELARKNSSMDRRKNQSTRSRNQMELCWSCGEKNRKPLDKPHSFWMPRGHTTNRGRPRTRLKDGSVSFVEHWHCVARGPVEVNGEGLRRPTTDIKRLKLNWRLS